MAARPAQLPTEDPAATRTTSADVFAYYRRRCGDAAVLTQAELRVEVRSAGLGYEELDEHFWAALFRRPDHRHLE
jgi:hypothetical protein